MSRNLYKLIKEYYNWFDSKIDKGADVNELISILYIASRCYLEDIEGIMK